MGFSDRLTELGFASYDDYLNGPHWKWFRQTYRKSKHLQACLVCGQKKYELHHTTYKRLGKEKVTDVMPLCREHHTEVHDVLKEHGRRLGQSLEAVKWIQSWLGIVPPHAGKARIRAGLLCRCGNNRKKDKDECAVCERNRRSQGPQKYTLAGHLKCKCGSSCKKGRTECKRCSRIAKELEAFCRRCKVCHDLLLRGEICKKCQLEKKNADKLRKNKVGERQYHFPVNLTRESQSTSSLQKARKHAPQLHRKRATI